MEDHREIAIYSRKSKWSEKGESIANQIELCRQYVALHFGSVRVREECIFEDEGYSGGNTRRPQFAAMMQHIRQGEISAVVCYRLDRISRNVADFSDMIEEFNRRDVAFVSIRENFDTSTPIGRAMMMIAIVFAQLERETIAERVRDNMLELAKTGRWLGGNTPFGYQSFAVENVKVDGKNKKSFLLREVEDEIAVVRMIFMKFLQKNSLTGLETELLQSGYVTKRGKEYSRFALKNILSNPVYAAADEDVLRYFVQNNAEPFVQTGAFDGVHGVMAYNRTLQKRGKANRAKDISEWIITAGKHMPVVSGALWVAVQERLMHNRDKAYRKPRSHSALLAGLLRCGQCGEYMRPKQSKRLDAQGSPVYDYVCTRKEKSARQCCAMKNVNGNMLDCAVCAEVLRLPQDGAELRKRLQQSMLSLHRGDGICADGMEPLKKQLAGIEADIAGLLAVLPRTSGEAQARILLRIGELNEKTARLRAGIGELEDTSVVRDPSPEAFSSMLQALSDIPSVFAAMSLELKRNMLRTLLQRAVWDGSCAHLYFSGAEPGEAGVSTQREHSERDSHDNPFCKKGEE